MGRPSPKNNRKISMKPSYRSLRPTSTSATSQRSRSTTRKKISSMGRTVPDKKVTMKRTTDPGPKRREWEWRLKPTSTNGTNAQKKAAMCSKRNLYISRSPSSSWVFSACWGSSWSGSTTPTERQSSPNTRTLVTPTTKPSEKWTSRSDTTEPRIFKTASVEIIDIKWYEERKSSAMDERSLFVRNNDDYYNYNN